MLKHSVIATINGFRYNRPGMLVVFYNHISIYILSIAALIAGAICDLQVNTNQTIHTEFVIGIARQNEQSVERHRLNP
jgi:hypothetical protein